jgi:hypothetical protein
MYVFLPESAIVTMACLQCSAEPQGQPVKTQEEPWLMPQSGDRIQWWSLVGESYKRTLQASAAGRCPAGSAVQLTPHLHGHSPQM